MEIITRARCFEFPSIGFLHKPIYWLHVSGIAVFNNLTRVLYWTPIFKSRLKSCGKGFYLYSSMPMVLGKLEIAIGDNTRMSGLSTLCGRSCSAQIPQLIIGNNVDIGWQNTITVGKKIVIEDNVRLAGKVFLAGFPGHPLNAKNRALGMPETDSQVGDIVLKKDVWLATGVTVMAGVTIGEGTVVASGSIVTRDLPAGVMAAGIPAKIIKQIE
jgi:acetyltransferase-like isoleucine patch superfamily enzyme